MSYDFDQQPRGLSSGAKVAIGCGAAAVLGAALLCGGVAFLGFLAVETVDHVAQDVVQELGRPVDVFATKFEAQGYQRVTGQMIDVRSDITQPTIYTVQSFKLNANSDTSLAVMAQMAEINGTINGDLDFSGQSLVIHPDSVITGDLHVEMAQLFENHGTVQGEVFRTETEFPAMLDDAMPPAAEALPAPEPKPSPGDVINDPPPVKPTSDSSADAPPAGVPAATDKDPAEPDNAADPTGR